jgi:hypothetical protein
MKKTFLAYMYASFFFYVPANLAQTGSDHWYFGRNAGIMIQQGKTLPLTDGSMNTPEGCASISTEDGQLLFYTNGETIWGRNHLPMPKGSDIGGNESSTQGALIVPYPGNEQLYYIFTTDYQGGDKGLSYSLVDISLNEGFGDLVQKNVPLLGSSTEKIAAVRESRDKVWVVAHEWDSNRFFSYPVDVSGIHPPVITSVGKQHSAGDASSANSLGCMKISPDGKKLALAIYGMNTIEIFDFDKNTGKPSNPLTLTYSEYYGPYGIAFSGSENYLYVSFTGNDSSPSALIQYNLSISDPEKMKRNASVIHKRSYPSSLSSLQEARNGKIYASIKDWSYLAVINDPEREGKSCNFYSTGIYLKGKKCAYGLPTRIAEQSIGAMPVPLERESISLRKKNETVVVEWTARTMGNYSFFVERAVNLKAFVSLTEINSEADVSSYKFVDQPEEDGDLYYRIIAVDENGDRTAYTAGVVRYSRKAEISIKNPVRCGEAFLPQGNGSAAPDGKIFNIAGELVSDNLRHAPDVSGSYIILLNEKTHRLQVIN